MTNIRSRIILNQMVYYSEQLDQTFSAISDPTRRSILSQLAQGEASIMELAAPHAMSLPAVSKHIRVLERSGLLTRTKKGRETICALNAQPLKDAWKWLRFYRRFWDSKLDALGKFLEENPD